MVWYGIWTVYKVKSLKTYLNSSFFCWCLDNSLAVDMWNPSLRGVFGRLISSTQSAGPTGHCLSFFYKLYGPNTGEDKTEPNVKLQ